MVQAARIDTRKLKQLANTHNTVKDAAAACGILLRLFITL